MTFTKNFRRKHRRPICRESVSLDKNRGASYVCKKASSTRKRGRSSKTLSKNDSGIAFRRSRFGTDFGTKIHEKSIQNRSKIDSFDKLRSTWTASGRIFASWGRLASLERLGRAPSSELGSLGSPKVAPACARVRHLPQSSDANSGIYIYIYI